MYQMDEMDLEAGVKDIINKVFWALFERNKDVKVFTFHKRILVIPISITVTLAELRPLFESIFGPEKVEDINILGV